MIKPDRPPFCDGIGVFWKFWMLGGLLYLGERIMREIRGKHKTYISKVIEHPSNVVEIQIKKEHTKANAGQYIFLCCPEVSIWQYHPFTLTSAPEEDYISVHVRMVGNFTKALGKTLGCDIDKKGGSAERSKRRESRVIGVDKNTKEDVDPAIRRVLPRGTILGNLKRGAKRTLLILCLQFTLMDRLDRHLRTFSNTKFLFSLGRVLVSRLSHPS